MSTITETAARLTEARQARYEAIANLREDYEATSTEVYEKQQAAGEAVEAYNKAHNLKRKAIDREFAEAVAEITGLDVEDVDVDNPYSDSPW